MESSGGHCPPATRPSLLKPRLPQGPLEPALRFQGLSLVALTPSRPGLDLNLTGLHPEHPSSCHLALDTGPPPAALHRPLVDEAPTLPSGAITVLCVSDSSPVLPGTRQRPSVLFLCFQPQNWPRSLPAEDASPTRLKTEAAWGAPRHQCLGERSPPPSRSSSSTHVTPIGAAHPVNTAVFREKRGERAFPRPCLPSGSAPHTLPSFAIRSLEGEAHIRNLREALP